MGGDGWFTALVHRWSQWTLKSTETSVTTPGCAGHRYRVGARDDWPRPLVHHQVTVRGTVTASFQDDEQLEATPIHHNPAQIRAFARAIGRLAKTGQAGLAELDQEIDDTCAAPAWRAAEDLLTSVPGIGKITARTLIADLPELGHLDRLPRGSLAYCERVTGLSRPLEPGAPASGRRARRACRG